MSPSVRRSTNIDSVYYRDGVTDSVSTKLLIRARISMFRLFMKEMAPTSDTCILDIGVSDEENEGANFLEKNYPWPDRVTCAGIGDGEAVKLVNPSVSFCRIEPGEKLPFEDGSFDIVCSNAVIEHVGGIEQRRTFIAEHLRIGRRAFITFPNRWFPVEHHTRVPFLHYSPILFRSILSRTKLNYWAQTENLDFLSHKSVQREWPIDQRAPSKVVLTGVSLGPLSSNVAVIVR